MKLIVAGVGTDVGKTVASAILVELLQADYWKPIQAGNLEASDSIMVRQLSQRPDLICHPETYRLKHPLSPHHAARLEGIEIASDKFKIPETKNHLVIEMSGGILSPLNDHMTQRDLYSMWDCLWVLVSKHYLGSINHTLLSIESMKQKNLPFLGIIFNGDSNTESESYILEYTKIPCLGRVNQENYITSTIIKDYSKKWHPHFPIT